jgi:hypothetical protein
MGEWFLPFLHGWRCAAARLGKMAKKPEAHGAELQWAARWPGPTHVAARGQAKPPKKPPKIDGIFVCVTRYLVVNLQLKTKLKNDKSF